LKACQTFEASTNVSNNTLCSLCHRYSLISDNTCIKSYPHYILYVNNGNGNLQLALISIPTSGYRTIHCKNRSVHRTLTNMVSKKIDVLCILNSKLVSSGHYKNWCTSMLVSRLHPRCPRDSNHHTPYVHIHTLRIIMYKYFRHQCIAS